jgi:hypothetical protein
LDLDVLLAEPDGKLVHWRALDMGVNRGGLGLGGYR